MRKLLLCAALFTMAATNIFAGKPVIGISSGCSSTKVSLNETYINAIFAAGGTPLVLPQARNREEAKELIALVDGVVFSGGEDVAPSYYYEPAIPGVNKINYKRDASDLLLIKEALKRKKAILGICRGEQIVNVALGGSLYQDILVQADSTTVRADHRNSDRNGRHNIGFVPGTKLYNMLGPDSLSVNSFHHQAVKELAPGMKLSASASDGVVEAYESTAHNVVCVQFHPEVHFSKGETFFLEIFKDLVRRASK